MLSKQTIEAYHRTTPGQGLDLTLQAIRGAEPYLYWSVS
jgi:hypothetical protein